MALFNQISIIGIGLIGGSLAKAIKKRKISEYILGFFRNPEKQKKAERNKIVDKGSLDLKKTVSGSDLIIVALPVDEIIRFLPKINKFAKPNAIITDVGSIKSRITDLSDKLDCNFVGSHPIAGSERTGIEFSQEDLFDDSLTIVSVTPKTRKKTLIKVRKFWQALGCRVITTTPQFHDTIVCFTSHLPHLASFGLMNSIPERFLRYSASGLRDTTRIAESSALLWSEIFLNNKTNLIRALNIFEKELKKLKISIHSNNKNALIKLLNLANNKREKLPHK